MKIFTLLILILIISIMYSAVSLWYRMHIGTQLVQDTTPFSIIGSDYTKTMLVLGDSTAYGVGSDTPQNSMPGKIARYLNSTYVENYSVSGAVAEDITTQLKKAQLEKYDVILLQVGANDITKFHDVATVTEKLEPVLIQLRAKSDMVIFITSGNVGGAPAVPFVFKKHFTNLNLQYHEAFSALSEKLGVLYVNTYQNPLIDPFVLNPEEYFAKDGFHPNTLGYDVWYTMIVEKFEK